MEFFEQLKSSRGINLTKQQKDAIICTEGSNLLLACPGSGKTTVMVIKTGFLIEQKNVNPSQILCLTFSKAAAEDMKKRYEKIFGIIPKGLSFSTIHSFCYKIMQFYFSKKGVTWENIELVNKQKLSKNILLGQIYERVFKCRPNDELIEDISGAISTIKNISIEQGDLNEFHQIPVDIQSIYKQYEEYKYSHGLYDFDDMLSLAFLALTQYPRLLTRIQQRFTYIQVDEAQDNSKLQNNILKLILGENSHLFMVADDDQTIYEWRGAYPEGILRFEQDYAGAKIFRMEHNFRSSQNIVTLSNQFIKKNMHRYDKNLITENPEHSPVVFAELNKIEDQYDFVVKCLQEKNNYLKEKAVLFRNNISTIPLADCLERAGISFCTRGYKGHFFEHWLLNDIKWFMLFARDISKLEYFDRIYYKNEAYISKKQYEQAKVIHSCQKNIFEALCIDNQVKDPQYHKIQQLKWQFKALARKSMKEAVNHILNNMGYQHWLNNSSYRSFMSKESMNNYLMIIKLIASKCKDTEDFCKRCTDLTRILEESKNNHQGDEVMLSTFHSAKGLEFDSVFMIDLLQGAFPSKEALGNQKKMEAERRLFYVGLTRARSELTILSFKTKKHQESMTSIFVEEAKEIQHPPVNV